MSAILKTLPTFFARGRIREFLSADFCAFYFTLGRGRPNNTPQQLYFTHRGRILGHFPIDYVCQNSGQLPKLTTLDGEPSEWQIKPDRWVAVCSPPFHRLEETIYHAGFRGWRYFDLNAYRTSLESKIKL